MRVLLTGATGFIGSHLADALEAAGHTLVCAVRDPARARRTHPWRRYVAIDFAAAPAPAEWLPLLRGVDAVVNTVGIVRERRGQSFEQVHVRAPQALFEACVQAQVARVLQFSALGADESASTRYHLSKRAADRALLALPLDAVVLQPSLVFGLDGASAQFFLQLAAAPVIPVPQGAGAVQPVHVDDVAELVVRLIDAEPIVGPVPEQVPQRVPVVGPTAWAWPDYLLALRAAIGLGRAPLLRVPRRLVDIAAALGSHLPNTLLDADAWQMLRRGNVASAETFTRCLGAAPRGVEQFVPPVQRRIVATHARLGPLLALLRWSIACVWLVSGIVSFGLYPVSDSLALLARIGVHDAVALSLLYGAAALDLLLGIATFAWPRRRLWLVQIALIVLYTLLISWRLPEYWLHPYGPVLKNLPMLAALALLLMLEPRR